MPNLDNTKFATENGKLQNTLNINKILQVPLKYANDLQNIYLKKCIAPDFPEILPKKNVNALQQIEFTTKLFVKLNKFPSHSILQQLDFCGF